MKQSYKLKNMGCANCAAKMERAVQKLDGVYDARINFMTARFTLEAEASRFDALLTSSQAIFKKYEPDCTISG